MEMIPSPRLWYGIVDFNVPFDTVSVISKMGLGFLRGVFLANHLASNDDLARTSEDRTHNNEN